MRESIRALVGSEVEKRVVIGLAKDGSGAGGTSLFPYSFVCLFVAECFPSCVMCATSDEADLEREV